MICRTAGNDIDTLQIFHIIVCNPHFREIHSSVFYIGADHILYRFRLFMDLFQHEMLIAAFLSRFRIPFDLHHFLLDLFPVYIIEMYFIVGQFCNLKIINIVHISCLIENRRYI